MTEDKSIGVLSYKEIMEISTSHQEVVMETEKAVLEKIEKMIDEEVEEYNVHNSNEAKKRTALKKLKQKLRSGK